MKSKICGVSDSRTLEYLTNHSCPPQYIGFIVNYPKSKRFVEYDILKEILKINKKSTKYVAVLVEPDQAILEKIKNLPFDYYQIYDCKPDRALDIKQRYKKKIIISITVNNQNDVLKYKHYNEIADIYLFDSKGYEKSLSFNHQLIKNLKLKQELICNNIKIDDNLVNYKENS